MFAIDDVHQRHRSASSESGLAINTTSLFGEVLGGEDLIERELPDQNTALNKEQIQLAGRRSMIADGLTTRLGRAKPGIATQPDHDPAASELSKGCGSRRLVGEK
jgi:hypothetical protein